MHFSAVPAQGLGVMLVEANLGHVLVPGPVTTPRGWNSLMGLDYCFSWATEGVGVWVLKRVGEIANQDRGQL